ncbi:hypothetical protein GCM10022222_38060 [Amycolatopsis ultiminotia]|uniref:Uncharacterized protein n=1 Tax=Amycolatopsis ultiminotia TaxID=543629 RepID=A0ABP6WJ96_9PSEU
MHRPGEVGVRFAVEAPVQARYRPVRQRRHPPRAQESAAEAGAGVVDGVEWHCRCVQDSRVALARPVGQPAEQPDQVPQCPHDQVAEQQVEQQFAIGPAGSVARAAQVGVSRLVEELVKPSASEFHLVVNRLSVHLPSVRHGGRENQTPAVPGLNRALAKKRTRLRNTAQADGTHGRDASRGQGCCAGGGRLRS